MPEITTSQRAKSDLKAIFLYSLRNWGDDKATEYLMEIEAGVQTLLSHPQRGQSRDDLRKGYRSIQVHRHVVYYRIVGDDINIVRVLHEKMLPRKNL